MLIRIIYLLALTLSVSSCAMFKGNKLPVLESTAYAVNSKVKQKVYVKWAVVAESKIYWDDFKTASTAVQRKRFLESLDKSGCCMVVESQSEADLIIQGKSFFEFDALSLIPAVITGASLYTIPSWDTTEVKIQALAKNSGQEKTYDFNDSVTLVQWLPMAIVFPFTGDVLSVSKDVEKNVFNNLVMNLKNDGFLSVFPKAE